MVKCENKRKSKEFLKEFYYLISKYKEIENLVDSLFSNGETFLFGGAARDYLINEGFSDMPRDFDFVYQPKRNNSLEELLSEYSFKKNRFGGFKLLLDNIEFDIWDIQETWAFKEGKVEFNEKEIAESLANTVFLNIDSIVFDFTKEMFFSEKYQEAMTEKKLDIILEDNPAVNLNLLRAIVYKRKYKMYLSEQLKKFFRVQIVDKEKEIQSLLEIQYSHYGKCIIDRNEIMEELDSILL